MVLVNSLGQQETAEKFAHLWFDGMARFHRVKDPDTWQFDEQHVIAYLRSKLSTRMSTGKRPKIIEGLRCEAEWAASAFWSIRFRRGLMFFL